MGNTETEAITETEAVTVTETVTVTVTVTGRQSMRGIIEEYGVSLVMISIGLTVIGILSRIVILI